MVEGLGLREVLGIKFRLLGLGSCQPCMSEGELGLLVLVA